LLVIFNLAGTAAAGQAPAPGKRVLMLYSDERLLPANIIMDKAIRSAPKTVSSFTVSSSF
jgi:hypothetical protein